MSSHSRASSSSGSSSYTGHNQMSSISPTDVRFHTDLFSPSSAILRPDSMLLSANNNGFSPPNTTGSQSLDSAFLLQQITHLTSELDTARGQLKERAASYQELLGKLEQYQTLSALGPPLAPTPDRDEYPDVLNWQPPTNVDDQQRYEFIVDANGDFVGKARTVVMSEHGKWCFQELLRRELAAATWGAHGLLAIVLFINAMEAAFPELALCADHWKAKAFARKLYPDWISRRGKEVSGRVKRKRTPAVASSEAGNNSDMPSSSGPPAKKLRGPEPSTSTALVPSPQVPLQCAPPPPPSHPPARAPVAPKNVVLALATLKPKPKALPVKLSQPPSRAAVKAQRQADTAPQPSTSSTVAAAPEVTGSETPQAAESDQPQPGSTVAAPAQSLPGVQQPSAHTVTQPNAGQQMPGTLSLTKAAPPPTGKQFRLFRNNPAPEHVLRCEWADKQVKSERTTALWQAYLSSADGQAALKLIEARVVRT
ncbi:hypothetical protein AURDEDRAFT_112950 [Auricularia subglabra TFB-10046 SS5]|nr:hypothetical protein AURDEDRAFT_112950 [Auricularia subglabra TFB-10046 SS5]